jgi:hypothetical protein
VLLNEDLGDAGDVLLRVSYHGSASNRVRLGIGHVGGGLVDDTDSVPTPGSASAAVLAATSTLPAENPSGITAGNLTADDVRNVIAQAVSAAVALNRQVTVAVTDREGNALGVFTMLNARSTTQLRRRQSRPSAESYHGISPRRVRSDARSFRAGGNLEGGDGVDFQHDGQRFHDAHGGLYYSGTFSAGRRFSIQWPAFRRAVFKLALLGYKKPGLPLGLSADPGGVPLYKTVWLSAASASKATEFTASIKTRRISMCPLKK